MPVSVDEIDFESHIEKKGPFPNPIEPFPKPTVTVGTKKSGTVYLSKKAVEMMGLIEDDYLAAAPNPRDNESFFLCPNTDGDGWSIQLKDHGAVVTRSVIAKIDDHFDKKAHYEIIKTGMMHPDWDSPIFLAKPVDIKSYEHRLHK